MLAREAALGGLMRRRSFLALVAGASAIRGAPSFAQSAPLPVIGSFDLPPYTETSNPNLLAWKRGLADAGKMEGRDYRLVTRGADFHPERLPALARELVAEGAVLIATASGTAAVRAALDASATVPVVAVMSEDPVAAGIAESLSHPGGRVTGVVTLSIEITAKQVEVIDELLPKGRMVGILIPSNYHAAEYGGTAKTAAQRLGRPITLFYADSDAGLDNAVIEAHNAGAAGLVIPSNPLTNPGHEKLVALAAKYALPAVYAPGDILARGGLMAYGATYNDLWRQWGVLTARVLAGAKPGELPFEEPTRIVLAINLKVAKEQGLTVPGALLARADQIIE
jgi:putative tryptophan/tyrosine transport system substrate-binding protein